MDWQHGAWTESSLNAALASFVHVDTVPLVRTLGPDPVWIGRMLDIGALGIIIPMVETAEQCEAIVRTAKLPPRGNRSATGLRTAYHANHDYFDYTINANNEILIIVMVETVQGIGRVREMMTVADVNCVVEPCDLSLSLGVPMGDPREEALVQEVLAASKDGRRCR